MFSVTFGPSFGSQRPGHGTELAYRAAIDGFWLTIAAGDHSDQGPGPDGRSVVV
jgi:hypothetical protein